jgi:16S rRNA (adenine1518-N6/adenine1519-N6)-dimethyltransferase
MAPIFNLVFSNPGTGKHSMDTSIDIPPLNISSLLREYQLKPKKGLGQNFLIDAETLKKIVRSAEVNSQDCVLEVGAGLGSLTRFLAQASRRVIAVELDEDLLPILEGVLLPWKNAQIVKGDILKLDPAVLVGEDGYLVVANIPYYITSALIRHLLEAFVKPTRMVLTVQREVAERICAQPGDMSLLALSIQVYGLVKTVLRIPAGAFYPAPKVDSAVVRIDLYPEPVIAIEKLDCFFALAKAGFSQKRKTLRNSLSAGMRKSPEQAGNWLETAGIDPQRRAETLSLGEWSRLVDEVVMI